MCEYQAMLRAKSNVLDAGGFLFHYWHAAYVNRAKRAAFSHLFVDAHSAEELAEIIRNLVPGEEWQLFATEPTPDDVRQRVIARYS